MVDLAETDWNPEHSHQISVYGLGLGTALMFIRMAVLSTVCLLLMLPSGCAHRSRPKPKTNRSTSEIARELVRDRNGRQTIAPPVNLKAAGRHGSDGGTNAKTKETDREEEKCPTVTLPKNPGPAANLVESFFNDWEKKSFDDMYAQMARGGASGFPTAREFRSGLERTPVRWRSVKIGRETQEGDSRYVSISIEVTDLPSIMGAFLFNNSVSSFREDVSKERPFPASPGPLGIETFMTVEQTWRVVRAGDAYKIQTGQEEAKNKRCRDKILGYFICAGNCGYCSVDLSKDPQMFRIEMARLMVVLEDNLGITSQQGLALVPSILAKDKLAKKNFEQLQAAIDKAIRSKHR